MSEPTPEYPIETPCIGFGDRSPCDGTPRYFVAETAEHVGYMCTECRIAYARTRCAGYECPCEGRPAVQSESILKLWYCDECAAKLRAHPRLAHLIPAVVAEGAQA